MRRTALYSNMPGARRMGRGVPRPCDAHFYALVALCEFLNVMRMGHLHPRSSRSLTLHPALAMLQLNP